MRLSDAIGLELERREKVMTFEEWWKTRHKDRRLYMKDESRAAWNHQQARIEELEKEQAAWRKYTDQYNRTIYADYKRIAYLTR